MYFIRCCFVVFFICVVTGETFSEGFEGSCAEFDGRTEVAIDNLIVVSVTCACFLLDKLFLVERVVGAYWTYLYR